MPPLEKTSLHQQLQNAIQSRELVLGAQIKKQDETEKQLVRASEASKKEEDETQQHADALAKELQEVNGKLWKAQEEHRKQREALSKLRRERKEVEEREAARILAILAQLVCLNTYI
jgi:hypothetical protein